VIAAAQLSASVAELDVVLDADSHERLAPHAGR
jgi:hypothetical protein